MHCEHAWHVRCISTQTSFEHQAIFHGSKNMTTLFARLWSDQSGQDLAEYALLIALIALVVIGAVTLLGINIQTLFNNVANALLP